MEAHPLADIRAWSSLLPWSPLTSASLPMGVPQDLQCRKGVTIRTSYGSVTSQRVCVRPGHDVIADNIAAKGKWHDCTKLVHQWETSSEWWSQRSVFVELGANVGACTIQMLMMTNATILAFEPNPANLFYLCSSLVQMPRELQSRVYVFPYGVGDRAAHLTLWQQQGNAGASQLENPTFGGTRHVVSVVRLDDAFPNGLPGVRLVKLDVQGFECRALRGMESMLRRSRPLVDHRSSARQMRACSTMPIAARGGCLAGWRHGTTHCVSFPQHLARHTTASIFLLHQAG